MTRTLFPVMKAAFLVGFVSLAPAFVNAQITTNATCLAQFAWMDNSQGQTPCFVSGTLSGQCNNGQWNVPAISGTSPMYAVPNAQGGANICRCNTVLYNLIQACSVCQGGSYTNWTDWKVNCVPNNVFIQQYPLKLPKDLHVQGWAYLNAAASNIFDLNAAYNLRNQPDSVGTGPASTGTQITGSQGPTYTGTQLPARPGAGSGSGGGKSTNIGAIVGGVVGGLFLIAVAAGLVLFFMRKNKRKRSVKSNEMMNTGSGSSYTAVPTMSSYPTQPMEPMMGALKPYKSVVPEDPSTFPPTPAGAQAAGYQDPYNPSTFSGPQYPQQGYGQPYPQQPRQPGAYSGAAEI